MAKFEITPRASFSRYNELNFSNLYLHQTYSSSNSAPTQPSITGMEPPPTGKVETSANNWQIYDGTGTGAKVVARAQDLIASTGKWCRSFGIVFENEKFKGSTLEVAGHPVEEGGEWAIVGGTGQFRMANGVIYKKLHQRNSNGNIIQLTIHGFCPQQLKAYKTRTWGTDSHGTPFDVKEAPVRLESITVRHGDIVDAIEFSYVDKAGQKRKEKMGGNGGVSKTITLTSSEYVVEVSGSIGSWAKQQDCIGSIKIVTNKGSYGPFGRGTHATGSYSARAEDGCSIAGFYGRSGNCVNALGFYIHPL